MKNVREQYTQSEWTAREQYYVDEIAKIEIPEDINSKTIQHIGAQLDKVNSEMKLELSYVERRFDTLDRMRRAIEKELFLLIKAQGITNIKSIDEVNGAVAIAIRMLPASDVLKGNPIDTHVPSMLAEISNVMSQNNTARAPIKTSNILQALRTYEERLSFLKYGVQILEDKHSRLITGLGAIKLESNLSNTGGLT